MEFALEPGETLVHQGPANLQRGWEAVGGRLYLTDRRLAFAAHGANLRGEPLHVPLRTIHEVAPCWTRLLGLLPLAPNGMAVDAGGTRHRFVVWQRRDWMAAIAAQLVHI